MTEPKASPAADVILDESNEVVSPQPPSDGSIVRTNDVTDRSSDDGIVIDAATSDDTRRPRATTTAAPASKKRARLSNTNPKDILGQIDSFHDLELSRMDLNNRVPWFKDHLIPSSLPVKYIEYPPDSDWESMGHKEMTQMFPFWKMNNGRSLGKKQIPRCLMLDSKTDKERLVVLNWWRSQTEDQQVKIRSHEGLQRYYRAPMRSASPFQFAQQRYGKGLHALDLEKEHEHQADRKARVALAKELEEQAAADRASTALAAVVTNDGDEQDTNTDERTTTAQTTTTTVKNSIQGMKTIFVRPTVANAPLGFKTVQSTFDLVQRFNLSVDILYCARTIPETCIIKDCVYPALDQNRGCCALHKQNWWVRKMGCQPQRRRGHLLLGSEYATRRTVEDVIAPKGVHRVAPVPCGCNNELCEGIGWSADTVRVPKYYALPEGLIPGEHRDKDRPLRLAPWHFPPDSRLQLPDGTWKILFGPKPEDFVCPDYDVSEFLNEPGMIEYQERKSLWMLPEWVYEMQAMEEGPLSLAEFQREEFRKQQKRTTQNAVTAALSHTQLIHSHSEANSKIQTMKKIRSEKRKRDSAIVRSKKRRTMEETTEERDDDDRDMNNNHHHHQQGENDPNHHHHHNNHDDDTDTHHHLSPTRVPLNRHFLFSPAGPPPLVARNGPSMPTTTTTTTTTAAAAAAATFGGMHPYGPGTEAVRFEEAAHRVWGHLYANYGRHQG